MHLSFSWSHCFRIVFTPVISRIIRCILQGCVVIVSCAGASNFGKACLVTEMPVSVFFPAMCEVSGGKLRQSSIS